MLEKNEIHQDFYWFNKPDFRIMNNRLHMVTSPDTDFWQNTHYNFQRDNGHCLFTRTETDFAVTVRTEFQPQQQYDQCGLMVRIDSQNWIKASVEYETPAHSRLGSVVTNLGYSDWATIDIDSRISVMWYRIQSKGNDMLIENSEDGSTWRQLRIAHLHGTSEALEVGVYACSPMDSSFEAIFDSFSLQDSHWR
ncbi:DUF1349 domain-containing protein [Spirochaeta africana]|uniref:DUF1349 domain-containing protein n=1 Tax=Spirochaeta africana (strain ATCC 700263 / DSM 8902 / Z-7692) TaxID=889378 RepID=H9ULA9_SPIAZ|nr:DUF1349 domain-containing protein [Spirochaeta africana]AFG38302.1 hypothetical protein Spiaf_2266 [Spirochaeta africana DSM 8902]